MSQMARPKSIVDFEAESDSDDVEIEVLER